MKLCIVSLPNKYCWPVYDTCLNCQCFLSPHIDWLTEALCSGTLLSPGSGRGEKRGHGEIVDTDADAIPRKKKYAKEAWPGRKPGPGQGLF